MRYAPGGNLVPAAPAHFYGKKVNILLSRRRRRGAASKPLARAAGIGRLAPASGEKRAQFFMNIVFNPFEAAAALVVAAAVLGHLNYVHFRMPHTIGLTVMGAVASLCVIALDRMIPGFELDEAVRSLLAEVDCSESLLQGMLSFLLFAGALHVNLDILWERRFAVLSIACFGVLISTAVVGGGFFLLARFLGIDLPLPWCFVFGALISPTDPVAVLGILKSARVPAALEAKIGGESLFNDGVGVVVFTICLAAATGGGFSPAHAAELFALEAVGGAVLGLVIGWIGYRAMKAIDEHNLEVLISLAVVMGGYALALRIHVAGPIAMAIAGLLIGNYGTQFAMSDRTREHLTSFWSLIDEILNSVLFLLIGMEILVIAIEGNFILAGVLAIPLVLLARALAVGLPYLVLRRTGAFGAGALPMMIWGGLRGGISIALALSLPPEPMKAFILTVTYVVVIFSVVVQGATMGMAARRFVGEVRDEDEAAH
jgi:CPA1 family monovalent cation:H+ antiporter